MDARRQRRGLRRRGLDRHATAAVGLMDLVRGQQVTCPHCWETIELTLDLSVAEQSYTEDCPVCCKSMAVSFVAVDGEVAEISVEAAD